MVVYSRIDRNVAPRLSQFRVRVVFISSLYITHWTFTATAVAVLRACNRAVAVLRDGDACGSYALAQARRGAGGRARVQTAEMSSRGPSRPSGSTAEARARPVYSRTGL